MKDEEVGELWRRSFSSGFANAELTRNLIRKLVDDRKMRYCSYFAYVTTTPDSGQTTCCDDRAKHLELARRDFGIVES